MLRADWLKKNYDISPINKILSHYADKAREVFLNPALEGEEEFEFPENEAYDEETGIL